MSTNKEKISNLFSKNKKNDEELLDEIDDTPEIEKDAEDETYIEMESQFDSNGDYDSGFENNVKLQGNFETDSDWENRVLCSDGNCIGVIGPDGRCKECGKPYEENEISNNFLRDEEIISDQEDFSPEDLEETNTISDESSTETESELDSDWDNRVLCSDGNCIGVIGPDGRCKECGKPFEG